MKRFVATGSILVLSFLALAACSSNEPSGPELFWKRLTGERQKTEPTPGANQPYPNLSSVPERPKEVTSAADRQKMLEGLASDRANALYDDQTLRARTGAQPSENRAQAPQAAVAATALPPPVEARGNTVPVAASTAAAAARPAELAAIVFFGKDSVRLGAKDLALLQQIAALQARTSGQLRVVAHASTSEQPNDIADRRLDAVRGALGKFGVPGPRIIPAPPQPAVQIPANLVPEGPTGAQRVDIFIAY
jgi:outer membrane protein OmpA-like peptidoglycan-associated protein